MESNYDDEWGWIRDDMPLLERLAEHWPGWEASDNTGLASVLGNDPNWNDYQSWSEDDRRRQLDASLTQWYGPEAREEESEQPEASEGEPTVEPDPWAQTQEASEAETEENR